MKKGEENEMTVAFDRASACCFTGHRPSKLPTGYDKMNSPLRLLLRQAIKQATEDGFSVFLCGMAMGVDLLAAEEVLRLRASGEAVKLIAALPCPEQANRWNATDKQRYQRILEQTDDRYIACPHYAPYAMGARNLWMTEHAARIIAVFDGTAGGTANTLQMARDRGLEIVRFSPNGEAILLPPQVTAVIDRLEENGYEAYAVGGCVRDHLLGLRPTDYDICTDALPEQVVSCFLNERVLETGVKHGTVTLLWQGRPMEITTFRTEEGYSDHRRPDEVTFVRTLAEDLSRRDFTVNAMAYHPLRGLIDLFGGRQDLSDERLRCVGEADKRFQEDALRILRALRFCARFGWKMDTDADAAVRRQKSLLLRVSAERVQKELNGLLVGSSAGAVLRDYADVLAVWIPEILPMIGFEQHSRYHEYDVWMHTVHSIALSAPITEVRLALLFHDMGKPQCFSYDEKGGHFYGHPKWSAALAEKALHRLKYSNKTIETIIELVKEHDSPIDGSEKVIRRFLHRWGEDRLRLLLEVKRGDTLAHRKDMVRGRLDQIRRTEQTLKKLLDEEACFSMHDLALNGNDLMAEGYPSGKQMGAILSDLLEAVLDGRLRNDREELLSYLRRRYPLSSLQSNKKTD